MAGPLADVYSVSAKSGAGGASVGIAGSLALNLIDTESSATFAAGAIVTTGSGPASGSVTLVADNETSSTALALPEDDPTSGGKLGIGASIALNIIANRSTAEVGIDAQLLNFDDLSLSATATHNVDTEAEAGAAGGIAVTPALALALVSDTTTADLGTLSGVQAASGNVSVTAAQSATEKTTASGKVSGGKAAIGAAVALALINDDVSATTGRAIDATGDVTFSSAGSSIGALEADASASGAAAADDSGNSSDGSTVDSKVDGQLGGAETQQSDADVGTTDQQDESKSTQADTKHSASSSEGKLSVAAAVAVNVDKSSSTAVLPNDINISAGGALTVESVNATDSNVTANGSASGAAIGIAAAAAVNAITETNVASLGSAVNNSAVYTAADGITVTALKPPVNATATPLVPQVDTFDAATPRLAPAAARSASPARWR